MDDPTDRTGDRTAASAADAKTSDGRNPEDLLGARLSAAHLTQLRASSIGDDIISERGYETVRTLAEANEVLVDSGFSRDAKQLRAPSLLIPLHGVSGGIVGFQSRPDVPRITKDGKTIKYETPKGAQLRLDVHPSVRAQIADPKVDLYVTEGVKKGDAAATRELCCIALAGVWGWRGKNEHGGTTALADWEQVALRGRRVIIVFDSDVMLKSAVQHALIRLKGFLQSKGADVLVVYLAPGPNGEKTGLDDFFARGGTVEQLQALATREIQSNQCDSDAPNGDGDKAGRALTDSGNAERFVDHYGADVRFVGPWRKWLAWDGRRWCPDETGQALGLTKDVVRSIYREASKAADDWTRKAIAKWAKSSEARDKRRAMLDLAAVEQTIAITHEVLDTNPWLLNVANGTLDLKTGKLRPHRRDDLITRFVPIEYDSGATCPTWNSFLARIFPDESLRPFVQRITGMCLSGDASFQGLIFCYGTGANGKTVLLRTLQSLLGPYAVQCNPDLLLEQKHRGHPTELATLFGARLAVATELGAGRRFDEVRLKQLTGNDRINARRMREDEWSFPPTHKLVIAGNHKPFIRGTDEGIWRRLNLLPFLVTIPEKERDPQLLEKLEVELPGILNWAIDGCLLWQRDGLQPPELVRAATSAYREEMDWLADFIATRCVVIATANVPAKDLYAAYQSWCSETNEAPLSQRVFGMRMTERGLPSRKSNGNFIYAGIGLKAADTPNG